MHRVQERPARRRSRGHPDAAAPRRRSGRTAPPVAGTSPPQEPRMKHPASRRRRRLAAAALAATGATIASLSLVPTAATALTGTPSLTGLQPFADPGLADVDTRTTALRPTAAQLKAVRGLGARVTWNGWGTPESLIKPRGFLATGLDAKDARRRPHLAEAERRALPADAGPRRRPRARQRQPDGRQRRPRRAVPAALRRPAGGRGRDGHRRRRRRQGRLRVLVDDGQHRGSEQGHDDGASRPGSPRRPTSGAPRGRTRSPSVVTDAAWTRFSVQGFAQQQQARLVALPLRDGSVRAVWEVNVVDSQKGGAPRLHVLRGRDDRRRARPARPGRQPRPRTRPSAGPSPPPRAVRCTPSTSTPTPRPSSRRPAPRSSPTTS